VSTDLELYEAIENQGLVGWLCRRCVLVVLSAAVDADGDPTPKGVTLADLVESATAHEREKHA